MSWLRVGGKYPQNLSCQSIKGYEFYLWSRVKLNTAQNSHHGKIIKINVLEATI